MTQIPSDHVKISKLPIAADKAAYTAAKEALTKYNSDMQGWGIEVDFEEQRAEYNKLVEAFTKSTRNLCRHEKAVRLVLDQLKAAKVEACRVWRSSRDRIRAFLESKGVTPAVAKVIADVLYSKACEPTQFGIAAPRPDTLSPVLQGCTKGVFAGGFKIPFDSSVPEDQLCWMRKQCATLYLENQEVAVSRMREGVQSMTHPPPGVQPSNSCIGALDTKSTFNWNPDCLPEGEKWFPGPKDLSKLRQALWISWTDNQDVSLQGWTFRHLPVLLTQYVGQSNILLIDSVTASQHGPELTQWLATVDPTTLAGYPLFTFKKGPRLFCPLGSQPVIVCERAALQALTEKVDLKERVAPGATQHHPSCVGVLPLLSLGILEGVELELKTVVASTLVRSTAHLPVTWRNHAAINEFKAALAPPNADIAA